MTTLRQTRTHRVASRWLSLAIAAVLLASSCPAAESVVEVQNAILKTIEATSVAAEVVGKVDVFAVELGDKVKVGQLLGKIRDSSVALQVSHAKIAMATARKKQQSDVELRLAQKRAEVADNELQRAESANAQVTDTYPPKEIDRLRLVAVSAKLEIERAKDARELLAFEVMTAENEYLQATELLERHSIKAPVDGMVVAVNRRVGEWVEPGTEFLKIVKIDRLRIEGFIASTDIDKQIVGQVADITVLMGNQEISVQGKVVFLSPDANPVNGQFRVNLEIDNSGRRFHPGMRVQATIHQDAP